MYLEIESKNKLPFIMKNCVINKGRLLAYDYCQKLFGYTLIEQLYYAKL